MIMVVLAAVCCAGCSRQEEQRPGPEASSAVTAKQQPGSGIHPDRSRTSVAILPASPNANSVLQAAVSGASGPFFFRWEHNGELLDGRTSAKLPPQGFVKGDRVTVVVEYAGGEARTSIVIGNSPPQVISVAFVDPYVHHGVDLVASPDGVDLDGDLIDYSYRWTINGEEVFGNDGPLLSGDLFHKGDLVNLTVIPHDDEAEGKPFHGVEFTIPNAPPRFETTPPAAFESERYSYHPVAADPDGDTVSYRLESAPEGMSIDSRSGEISWEIGSDQQGEHHIKIEAQDEEGAKTFQEYILNLSIKEPSEQ